jgi:hypothetical protein
MSDFVLTSTIEWGNMIPDDEGIDMNRNMTLVLFAFYFLVFSSCSTVIKRYDYPTLPYEMESSSELGTVYSHIQLMMSEKRYNLLNMYFQSVFPFRYEDFFIWISIRNWSYLSEGFYSDEDTMLYMYIDECRITLPSGSVIDLLDNISKVNYTYPGRDYVTRAPPKMLRNVQPQNTEDGRKALYLDSIQEYNYGVSIELNAKLPSSVNAFRMEFTLTVVWENLGEVKIRKNMIFEKKSEIAYPYNV